MKDFEKKVISLSPEDKQWLDEMADTQGMTTNQLIRIIISNYKKQLDKEKGD